MSKRKCLLILGIMVSIVIFLVWFVLPSMTPEAILAEIHQKYRLPKEVDMSDPDDITINSDDISSISARVISEPNEPDTNPFEPIPIELEEDYAAEPSVVEFQCPCGYQYEVSGYDLCYSQKYSIVTDIEEHNEPEEEPAANWVEAVERWPNAVGYITDNFGNTRPINEPELKEPEFADGTIYIWEPEKPMKVSLDFIPTWPDYIELDKGLVIDMPYKMWYGPNVFKTFEFPKGTKIYFKE